MMYSMTQHTSIMLMRVGFPLAPKSKKVIVLKTDKHVYQGGVTSKKIMVLIAASASGHYVKPLIIYPGVQLRTVT